MSESIYKMVMKPDTIEGMAARKKWEMYFEATNQLLYGSKIGDWNGIPIEKCVFAENGDFINKCQSRSYKGET